MPKEFESSQYDRMYAEGGSEGIYDLPYRYSAYYPLFKRVFRMLQHHGTRSVLEVGCGTGAFAHLLTDRNAAIRYRGFDFSPIAIKRATARAGKPDLFFVGDAKRPESYDAGADSIVCTEVLEHIDADLDVVGQWAPGTFCVCSVPNFDADSHVRHFVSESDVQARYGSLIDIERIVRIKKPALPNLSWRSYLRALRWNRYRPSRLRAIVGMASFDELGGWFLFSGMRRSEKSGSTRSP